MYAERQARFPKGTYKVQFSRRNGAREFHCVNLNTGARTVAVSVWEMLKAIEYDLASNRYPQNAVRYRSWMAPGGAAKQASGFAAAAKAPPPPPDSSPTFVMQVLFRQNATWQGTIQWIEGRQTKQYRSMNELLMLMDEAEEITAKNPPTRQSPDGRSK